MADPLQLVWALGCLVLVLSALAARRLPAGRILRMALVWLGIFALAFTLFSFRSEFDALAVRLRTSLNPEAGAITGSEFRVPLASDGHFWVRGQVNGVATRFLVDSGASITGLSIASAKAAGIDTEPGGFGAAVYTANGTIMVRRIRIARLEIGPITRDDLRAFTAPEFGETNVLGMNFLSTLSGWSVEGNSLVLRP